MTGPASQAQRWAGWACALAVLVCLLLIDPRLESGIRDDWSYIFSAKRLAETGHIAYNGWAAPVLGPQLYLGALFIRVFGFSFLAVRSVPMLLAVLSAPLAYATLRRAGIGTRNAVLGTLTMVLSPLFLPLATSFMTDIAGLLLLLLFFYCSVRAVSAASDKSAMLWMSAAAATGLLGGSVRQTDWLTVLACLPWLTWQGRRRRLIMPVGVALWICSVAIIAMTMHWFNQQAFISAEPLYYLPHGRKELHFFLLGRPLRMLVSMVVLLLPVLTGLAMMKVSAEQERRGWLAVGGAALLVIAVTARYGAAVWGKALIGDYVTVYGITRHMELLGMRPLVVPGAVQVCAAFITLAVLALCAVNLWMKRPSHTRSPLTDIDCALLGMGIAFTLPYILLVLTRQYAFDRYLLPLLFLGVLLLLRWTERSNRPPVTWIAFLPLLFLSLFAVTGTHDLFQEMRARLAAADAIRAAGVPRTQIQAGFEYDGWTELEQAGHVNEPRIHPASAYHPVTLPAGLDDVHPSDTYPWRTGSQFTEQHCYMGFRYYTPSIHPRYILESDPGFCFRDAPFAPVRYRTWLPPHENAIHAAEVPAEFR